MAELPNDLQRVVETHKAVKPLKHEGTASTLENNVKSSQELRAELLKIVQAEEMTSIEKAIHVNIKKKRTNTSYWINFTFL